MKIEPGKSVSAPTPRRGAEATASGFALPSEPAPRVAPTTATMALTPLDALLALQSDEPSRQRRARQTKRGHDALAALEEVARGLLLGRVPAGLQAELDRLRGAAELTGETGLDDLLREIDTRLAVEAAKLERAVAA
jgi:hypothetical protein